MEGELALFFYVSTLGVIDWKIETDCQNILYYLSRYEGMLWDSNMGDPEHGSKSRSSILGMGWTFSILMS